MRTTQRHEHTRVGLLERTPGERTTPAGLEFDHKFIASTELLASDHGVIYVSGWNWNRYMQRPRWIANHDLGAWSGKLTEVSLGKAVHVAVESGLDPKRVGPSGKALVVYVRYAQTRFAQEVRSLYDQGGLDDVSVRWDWRTEVTRNPYEEEVQKFGEDLYWVCERADLVELSAVLLGADAGAQMLRGDVLEAFERCRAQRIDLPEIERLIRESRPRSVISRPDPSANRSPVTKTSPSALLRIRISHIRRRTVPASRRRRRCTRTSQRSIRWPPRSYWRKPKRPSRQSACFCNRSAISLPGFRISWRWTRRPQPRTGTPSQAPPVKRSASCMMRSAQRLLRTASSVVPGDSSMERSTCRRKNTG